jgi:hypothetical protein
MGAVLTVRTGARSRGGELVSRSRQTVKPAGVVTWPASSA